MGSIKHTCEWPQACSLRSINTILQPEDKQDSDFIPLSHLSTENPTVWNLERVTHVFCDMNRWFYCTDIKKRKCNAPLTRTDATGHCIRTAVFLRTKGMLEQICITLTLPKRISISFVFPTWLFPWEAEFHNSYFWQWIDAVHTEFKDTHCCYF